MRRDYDVIVVGCGAVGATYALALERLGKFSVAVIETTPLDDARQERDGRGLALSLTSQTILDALGVWQLLAPMAQIIERLHVSEQGRLGAVRVAARSLGVPVLGYMVPAHHLMMTFRQTVSASPTVDLLCPAMVTGVSLSDARADVSVAVDGGRRLLTARLLVIADGTASPTRALVGIDTAVKDYAQAAIVATVTTERDHAGVAYERFTANGPLAVLPGPDRRQVVVMTVAADRTDDYLQLNEPSYLDEIARRFGRRLGRLSDLGRRRAYPLQQSVAEQQVITRTAILGNAAHTLHPNGAQGLNLGLRDAMVCAETVTAARGEDIGGHAVLRAYQHARSADQQRVVAFTAGLADAFYTREPLKMILRNAAMFAIDVLPPLKHCVIRRAMGVWRPPLVATNVVHANAIQAC